MRLNVLQVTAGLVDTAVDARELLAVDHLKPSVIRHGQFLATAVLCLVLACSAVTAGLFIAEALEERSGAAAAAELRFAAQSVASADALRIAGAEPSAPDLATAVDRLTGDHEAALHSLNSSERMEANRLLGEMVVCGTWLLSLDGTEHEVHDHAELQALLATASSRGQADANDAERRATVLLLLAAAAAGVVGWFLIQSRVSEIRLRRSLLRQATTDHLTGLPNRRILEPVLAEARSQMEATGCATGLVVLDLDGFKDINDTLGHHAGDELLARIAERLRGAQREGEVLLRLGGDEFAVVIPGLEDAASAQRAAGRYLHVLRSPLFIESRPEHLRTSLGVATAVDPERVVALSAEADIAMYQAKRSGGDRVAVFDRSMEAHSNEISHTTRALRAAVYDDEFSIVYQPIVTVDGTTTVGYEALLRWTSPTRGHVGPDSFIPVAERSGEIYDIGSWVLRGVCRQLSAWDEAGLHAGTTVSCNVSPHQLAHDRFVDDVIRTLDQWSVPRHRLVIEVTESAVLDHGDIAVQRLSELRRADVKVSIDDFGSGYSNLGQLLHVPFDVIKIDRSLLVTLTEMREQAGRDPAHPCAILEAIASIAGVFDAPVVCEGVETEQQRRAVEASGITHIQGYLTGRPASPEDLRTRAMATLQRV